MLLRLPKLAASLLSLILSSVAAPAALAQTDPYGIFDVSGNVTFLEPSHQGQFASLSLGDGVWGTLRLDLSMAPGQGPMNSLLYATMTNNPTIFVGSTYIPRENGLNQQPLIVTDGVAPFSDRIDYEYPVQFWGGTGVGSILGTAYVSFVDVGGDAWSSPVIAGLPFPLQPDAALGQSATLSVVAEGGALILEAELDALYLDLSNESHCSPVLNSTFQTGRLTGIGSRVAADNSFSIFADRLPMDSFGLFITSATEGFIQNPGGQQGNLCLNGQIGRYMLQVQSSGTTGTIQLDVDLANVPTVTGVTSVNAGDTRYFQLWHRDTSPFGVATSNFTSSLAVQFL